MKHEPIKRDQQESLASDFALIGEAFLDAFRGMSGDPRPHCRCTKIHYAAWR